MRNGVTSALRHCISQHQNIYKSYTFDEFLDLARECVVRLDLDRPSTLKSFNPTLRGINPTLPGSSAAPSSMASGANNVPLGGDPMILDRVDMSHIGPDGRLTYEERQRRFKLRLCMRCGQKGHHVSTCSHKRKEKAIMEVSMEDETSDLNPVDLKD